MDTSQLVSFYTHYQLLDVLLGLLLLIVSVVFSSWSSPYCRPFSWTDPTIDYPYFTSVTFPTWTLVVFIVLALLLYTAVVSYLGGTLWVWLKAQLLAVISQLVVVNMLKVYAGRIRPDYLNRLRSLGFKEESHQNAGMSGTRAAEYYCRLGDEHRVLREGRLSFPSGHSSTSFAVMTFMSLFLFAYTRPSARGGSFFRLLMSLSPMVIAFLCAVSRTRDYWHHFDDIVAGALLGSVSALLCFYNAFRITEGGLCVARAIELMEQEERVEATPHDPQITVIAG
ncbi:phosphatidic acid phosphatase protein [Trypanosoma rangeli]|uniref:Phosphatidic acid phosphatase protein n=1 Tax=Trypanosoma rangeli TaxID=5698 RepID=A0A3S5IRX0_TRYRA|nr:phosphatidic acid phosphatase protein [Trypanosoma rangeli]RNF09179.1 phosphatidic acid phosphatase protein [Trypanosoma rangeli]|eukprot:RNF09179.1 phosphatidic acid phosphatase protein [Trypanosoma rangeli]